jgi:NAD(P)-dependent dehydrogenase (short-subunit alcohol dehydrogenase family)
VRASISKRAGQSACSSCRATLIATRGRIDVLINVAGVIEVGPMAAMDIEDFERAMAVNFWGPLRFMRAVTPSMIASGGGRIANVSSVGGLVAVPHLLPYVSSKFALTGFSLGARAELAKDGVGVCTVCPGLMRTGSPPNATFKGDHAAEYAWFASGDSTPFLSVSAEAAARRIVRGIVRNEAMVRIGAPAKVAAIAAAVMPNVVSGVMAFANALLPSGDDATPKAGKDSISPQMPTWLTALSDRASAHNNENGATTH